jgi:hypothetical protein
MPDLRKRFVFAQALVHGSHCCNRSPAFRREGCFGCASLPVAQKNGATARLLRPPFVNTARLTLSIRAQMSQAKTSGASLSDGKGSAASYVSLGMQVNVKLDTSPKTSQIVPAFAGLGLEFRIMLHDPHPTGRCHCSDCCGWSNPGPFGEYWLRLLAPAAPNAETLSSTIATLVERLKLVGLKVLEASSEADALFDVRISNERHLLARLKNVGREGLETGASNASSAGAQRALAQTADPVAARDQPISAAPPSAMPCTAKPGTAAATDPR